MPQPAVLSAGAIQMADSWCAGRFTVSNVSWCRLGVIALVKDDVRSVVEDGWKDADGPRLERQRQRAQAPAADLAEVRRASELRRSPHAAVRAAGRGMRQLRALIRMQCGQPRMGGDQLVSRIDPHRAGAGLDLHRLAAVLMRHRVPPARMAHVRVKADLGFVNVKVLEWKQRQRPQLRTVILLKHQLAAALAFLECLGAEPPQSVPNMRVELAQVRKRHVAHRRQDLGLHRVDGNLDRRLVLRAAHPRRHDADAVMPRPGMAARIHIGIMPARAADRALEIVGRRQRRTAPEKLHHRRVAGQPVRQPLCPHGGRKRVVRGAQRRHKNLRPAPAQRDRQSAEIDKGRVARRMVARWRSRQTFRSRQNCAQLRA